MRARTLPVALLLLLGACRTQADVGSASPEPEPTVPEATVSPAEVETYAGVRFVTVPEGGRIDRIVDGQAEPFAELAEPRAMVFTGSQLYVASGAALVAVSLASGEVTPVAADVGRIESLALDHIGYVLASVPGRGLLRIAPDGSVSVLAEERTGRLSVDETTRQLNVTSAEGTTETIDLLAVTGDDAEAWARRDARVMKPFTVGEVMLAGAEYWPYRGDALPEYPQDVLWGFYPEEGVVFEGDRSPASATPEAVACAEQSYRALQAFVAKVPEAFFAAVKQGRSPRFYLWVNDYSQASETWSHDVRPGRMWYWQRKPAVPGRVPGYWKWETTLTRDGQCQIPQADQIAAYLAEAKDAPPSR